jgi:hypothetical protein
MPARLSDARANNTLDVEFAGAASTSPATRYLALLTTAPTTNTGTSAVEVAGGAYARVAVTKNATNWPAAAARAIANGVAFTWPTATAGWGTVVGVASYDAAVAGTFLDYFDLAVDKAVASGDTPQLAIDALTATSSGT